MDMTGLEKNAANFVPLSPLTFLQNTARIYPHRPAIVYGDRRLDWQTMHTRCRRLAAAFAAHGISVGDVVSYVAANTPELIEAHYAVPMAGAVLNAINTRLDAATLRYIFTHAESKIVFVDAEFADKVEEAVSGMDNPPLLVDIVDDNFSGGKRIGQLTYEALLESAGEAGIEHLPADEWQPISLNYTSGTTGNPKGVVYHHRGAYLMAMGSVPAWNMRKHCVYLYTVPMFHCNGWGYPWTVALLAGTFVCLRRVDGADILQKIAEHKVEYLGGAPVVLSLIAEAGGGSKLPHPVNIMTAGAPPPPSILAKMEAMGFSVTHVYGLTETFGHTTICAWQEEWQDLPAERRAELQARQGVGYPILQDWAILDADNNPLPADGETMGEIGLRGNTIMSGYLKNPQATAAVFAGDWFKSGDLAVLGADGYLQIKDRLKDVIISGGENISSVAVENALCRHPAVLLAAVVAMPHEKWGETPCAFIETAAGAEPPSEEELIAFAREHLPHYMCPRCVVLGELPKTATGKIKKYELRERASLLSWTNK